MSEEEKRLDLVNNPEDRKELAKKVTRSTLWQRIFIVSALAFNAAVLGTLITLAFLIRGTQTEGSPTTKRLINISEQIADCTNEGGQCAAKQARDTGKALLQIKGDTEDTVIFAFVCQERLHTQDPALLRECVTELREPGQP
jgi:hypothetical protein